MEKIFQLHLNHPLTVEVIQNILSQQVSLSYSPDLKDNPNKISSDAAGETITPAELNNLAIGLGSEVPAEITRMMLLLLADFFAKHPGKAISPIIFRILEFYQFEVIPQVFSQGLYVSPTVHLILPVFGAGKVYYQGYLLKAADVHDIFSWQFVPWPEKLPAALTLTSFLGLGNLIYCFIQFKKIFRYSQALLPVVAIPASSKGFFPDQLEQLESQLNNYLAFPEAHPKHVNGLAYQLVKLLSTFGEHIWENFLEVIAEDSHAYPINNNILLKPEHLFALMQTLSQENFIMFEDGFDTNSGHSSDFTNRLMMQPFQILKNLEQIMAIATLFQLTIAVYPEDHLNLTANLKATYRNQIIDVLQEAIFDELIRKTISFMYVSVPTS